MPVLFTFMFLSQQNLTGRSIQVGIHFTYKGTVVVN